MQGVEARAGRSKVLLLADDINERGGIRTRVLGEISAVSDHSDILLVVKTCARNLHIIQRTRDEIRASYQGTRTVFVPFLPHQDLPILKELFTAANCLLLFLVGLVLSHSWRPDSIYSHNMECSSSALALGRLLGLPMTADLHGDEVEENVANNGWRKGGFRNRIWRRWLKQVIVRSPLAVCVSERHKRHLEGAYGRLKPSIVIPCCISASCFPADEDLNEARKDLAFANHDYALLYCGSAFKYQMLDEMVRLFRKLRSDGENCAILLLISDAGSLGAVRRMFTDSELSSVRMKSVAHESVIAYAHLADIALLFREDTLFNNISSPTKFAEYLCAGLPVLMTQGIGDYSDIVKQQNIGSIVDLPRLSEPGYATGIVRELMAKGPFKERCREYFLGNLAWNSYQEPLLRAFSVGKG